MAPIKLDFVTLDVFTDKRFLGNPLAVVFIPAALRSTITQETKQRIAREFNLSETVFLHTLDDEANNGTTVTTREIDIFTIDEELPFAGHPTIGSAYLVLHHLGWNHVNTLLTKAGPIGIESLQDGGVRATIPHAVHIHKQTLSGILDNLSGEAATAIQNALSNNPDTRAAELSASVVSIVKGMTFVLVKLPSLEHLAQVSTAKLLDFNVATGLLDAGDWEKSFVSRYYYVPDTVEGPTVGENGLQEWTIRSRMVELACEDPATGSAACTLASYLTISGRAAKGARFNITQGVEMGRKSDIVVESTALVEGEDVEIKGIFLGETSVVVMNGSVLV